MTHTSTFALTNATFPYLLELANHGLESACERHPALKGGVNTYNGYVTHAGVAESPGPEVPGPDDGGVREPLTRDNSDFVR